MLLEKGGLIFVTGGWFIIVNIRLIKGEIIFDCICDNANNIYSHQAKEVDYAANLKEINQYSFTSGASDKFNEICQERKIPYEVIVEVLAGGHDDRFDHWYVTE